MCISEKDFNSLKNIVENGAKFTHEEKGGLIKQGYLDQENQLTDKAYDQLQKHKVDNAIILAAGFASRFAPLSFEKPKGLLRVKGEILIERQIEQLKSKGIDDITLVVGYLKEQFFYLEEKYGVKIVVNEDYWRFNNTSSIALILDRLANTYICSSDNYFIENPFSTYEYQAYYSAEYAQGKTGEYCLTTNPEGLITNVEVGGNNAWYMIGHAYFSADFSKKFTTLFRHDYCHADIKTLLWEDFYARHLHELHLYILKNKNNIFEFDSVDELREFDPNCFDGIHSRIINNIVEHFHCQPSDIKHIKKIKDGMTNNSFAFNIGDNRYVYRHPGHNTDEYINRSAECFSMNVAKNLDLDKSFIVMNEEEGWKLSHFVEGAENLDYSNEYQVIQALSLLKRLHDANIKSDYDFDVWQKTLDFVEKLKYRDKIDYPEFNQLFNRMKELYAFVQADNVEPCLCHCDSYAPNFMVHGNQMNLIDWEYSGNSDPAYDLGVFICCAEDYQLEDAYHVLELYFNRQLTIHELRHHLAFVALASFYWFVWALYQESCGRPVGSYLYLWHKNTDLYCKEALQHYRN